MDFKQFLYTESSKPAMLGKYRITYIDSNKFRKKSLLNVEFCTAAVHDDFPRHIKKDEIWIDDSIKPKEIPTILKGLSVRLSEIENGGKNPYEKGIAAEKKERNGHREKLKKKKHMTIKDYSGEIEVYLVSGKAVRDNYKTDFSQGGHGYVYDWIPKNEIWIEDEEKDEIAPILAHEYIEMVLMKESGWKYPKAHEMASDIEQQLRKKNLTMKGIDKVVKNISILVPEVNKPRSKRKS